MRDAAGTPAHLISVIADIAARKAAEAALAQTLAEQRARGRDDAVRRDLKAVEDRLLALAEVQGPVYAGGGLDAVDMRALLADTARALVDVYGDGQVALKLDLRRPLSLPVRRAALLALLLYELMLGALTHGFEGRAGEELMVALVPEGQGGAAELAAAGNGRGFDPAGAGDGMGWPLIQQMAAAAASRAGSSPTYPEVITTGTPRRASTSMAGQDSSPRRVKSITAASGAGSALTSSSASRSEAAGPTTTQPCSSSTSWKRKATSVSSSTSSTRRPPRSAGAVPLSIIPVPATMVGDCQAVLALHSARTGSLCH